MHRSFLCPQYILADDLTGAHDVAIPFAKRGFAVAVVNDPDRLDRFDAADLVVLNTNTRSCGEAETAERVGAACEAIAARPGALIYKKIDSLLRGNVGFEIDLVKDLLDFGLAVCAPAFPEMNRTTVGGYHLLRGVPIRRMDMAGPDIPPPSAFIPDLLNRNQDDPANGAGHHIDLKTVQAGSAAMREALARIDEASGSNQRTTVVVDMADPASWEQLLDAVFESHPVPPETRSSTPGAAPTTTVPTPEASLLLCGSGGMAGALAERMARTWRPRNPISPASRAAKAASPRPNGPVLVFACSLHETTRRQVEELAVRDATNVCLFDPLAIVDEQKRGNELDRLTNRIADVMAQDRDVVVRLKRPRQPEELQAWLKRLSETAGGRDPASMVIKHLGTVARRLFSMAEPAGLVLTGGETAESVFRELDHDGAWILDEIEPGVALAAVAGGPRDDLPVVVKAGSFGDERTLARAMERLSTSAGDTPDCHRRTRLVNGPRNAGSSPDAHPRDDTPPGGRGSDPNERPLIGITLGDPNGVGPEIIVKLLSQAWVYALCRPLVIGNNQVVRQALPLAARGETEPNLHIRVAGHPADGLYRHGTVDVLNAADLQDVDIGELKTGEVQTEAGRLAVASVRQAARLALAREIDALVTAPLNKVAAGLAGCSSPGHTELLAEITGTKRFRLALAFDGILVSHATTHVSLREAVDRLSGKEILDTVDLVGRALVGMGVATPRIAVCGLNPHAGEGGRFGDEEIRIIAPALAKARKTGWRIIGPLPPDTVFMRARNGDFDGIIGMYHDQGHIPVKAIAFDRTVNVTLGLPIIRTSVDHGTAFDIAGRGIADAGNLGEALRMAVQLVGNRWSVGAGSSPERKGTG